MTRNETPSPDQGRRPRARMRPRAGRDQEQASPSTIMHATLEQAAITTPNANGYVVGGIPDPKPQPQTSPMISLEEVQRRLRIPNTALAAMTRDPGFPLISRLSGKHRLVHLAQLNAWLAARWRLPAADRRSEPVIVDARGRRLTRVARRIDEASMAAALAAKVTRARRAGGPHETLPALTATNGRSVVDSTSIEFWHVAELAEQLRATRPHTLRLLARPGAPAVLYLGRRAQLVRAADVEGWLARTGEQLQHALPAAVGGAR